MRGVCCSRVCSEGQGEATGEEGWKTTDTEKDMDPGQHTSSHDHPPRRSSDSGNQDNILLGWGLSLAPVGLGGITEAWGICLAGPLELPEGLWLAVDSQKQLGC